MALLPDINELAAQVAQLRVDVDGCKNKDVEQDGRLNGHDTRLAQIDNRLATLQNQGQQLAARVTRVEDLLTQLGDRLQQIITTSSAHRDRDQRMLTALIKENRATSAELERRIKALERSRRQSR